MKVLPGELDAYVLDFVRWLWDTAAVRSLLGVVALVAVYALGYGLYLRLRRRRFMTILPFRLWGDKLGAYPGEGLAARLGDEMLRLQIEMAHLDLPEDPERAASEAAFHSGTDVAIPAPAQVTIEYKGISPDAVNSYLRRVLGRQEVISGDLMRRGGELLLAARSARLGPWEARVPAPYDESLAGALREIAARAIADLHPGARLAVANVLATRQLEADTDEEALDYARLALEINPDDPLQYYNLGVALGRLGRSWEAIEAYSEALPGGVDTLGEDPEPRPGEFPSARINRAAAYLELGEPELALADYEAALSVKRDSPAGWLGKAIALSQLKRYRDAIAAFSELLRLGPEKLAALDAHRLHDARINRGLLRLREGEPGLAAEDFRQALESKPESAKLWEYRGQALERDGQAEAAREAYATAAELWEYRGQALERDGRAEAAREAYETAAGLRAEADSGRGPA